MDIGTWIGMRESEWMNEWMNEWMSEWMNEWQMWAEPSTACWPPCAHHCPQVTVDGVLVLYAVCGGDAVDARRTAAVAWGPSVQVGMGSWAGWLIDCSCIYLFICLFVWLVGWLVVHSFLFLSFFSFSFFLSLFVFLFDWLIGWLIDCKWLKISQWLK